MRAYDTKSQIISVGCIFALGIVSQIDDAIGKVSEVGIAYIMVAWGIVILPILLFGLVLYPSRKTAPHLSNESTEKLEQILYVDPNKHANIGEFVNAIRRADPINELAFELLKVSKLRELKRRRFVRALFATGVSFAVLFAVQLFESFASA